MGRRAVGGPEAEIASRLRNSRREQRKAARRRRGRRPTEGRQHKRSGGKATRSGPCQDRLGKNFKAFRSEPAAVKDEDPGREPADEIEVVGKKEAGGSQIRAE